MLRGLRGAFPGDFGKEREGDFFLEEGDAVFARVGGGRCGDEGEHFWRVGEGGFCCWGFGGGGKGNA